MIEWKESQDAAINSKPSDVRLRTYKGAWTPLDEELLPSISYALEGDYYSISLPKNEVVCTSYYGKSLSVKDGDLLVAYMKKDGYLSWETLENLRLFGND